MSLIDLTSSAGRRPARHYFRHFLALGDDVRAYVRMRPELRRDFRAYLRKRGYIRAVDRSDGSHRRFYIRTNTDLDQFVLRLHHRFTWLDREAILYVLQLQRSPARDSDVVLNDEPLYVVDAHGRRRRYTG